LPPMNRPGTG